MIVRALRNSNPGNLRQGPPWYGLMPPAQMTPAQRAETAFAVFESPVYGFRALGIVLLNYQREHHLDTIRQIVTRWAPPNENDTAAYIEHVAQAMQTGSDVPLNLSADNTLRGLMRAIAVHESGGWFFEDADLDAGAAAALSAMRRS